MTWSGKIKVPHGEHAELIVEYDYSPSTPDVFYLRNGDPGHPGDPEEIDWSASLLVGGVEVPLDGDWLNASVFEDLIREDVQKQIDRACPDLD